MLRVDAEVVGALGMAGYICLNAAARNSSEVLGAVRQIILRIECRLIRFCGYLRTAKNIGRARRVWGERLAILLVQLSCPPSHPPSVSYLSFGGSTVMHADLSMS